MKLTTKTKMVHGRHVPIVEIETITKEAIGFGKGGCHVTLPVRHLGRNVDIKILSLQPFVCNNCFETISRERNFSPAKDICAICFNEQKAMDQNKCLQCGGENPKEEYCGVCVKCFKEAEKEAEKENRRVVEKLEEQLKSEGLIKD